MSELSLAALQVAISQIGQKEDPLGSNWGHPVQDYLLRAGCRNPAPWCMGFMYYCFDEAAQKISRTTPLYKTVGVLDQYNHRRQFVVMTPQPGDIFIMDLGKGTGHTGIIESIDPDGTLHTIEGNTNSGGSREGIEVERKIRKNAAPIIAYLRF